MEDSAENHQIISAADVAIENTDSHSLPGNLASAKSASNRSTGKHSRITWKA